MDLGSTSHLSSPLERFLDQQGLEAPNLLRARTFTADQLIVYRERLASVAMPTDASIVLFGSWARQELTEASDHDWAIIVDGPIADRPELDELVAAVGDQLGTAGSQSIFGTAFSGRELAENVGLEDDGNRNLTRRALLLLESTELAGSVHAASRRGVLGRYLNHGVHPYKAPRFLLNDIVRYWRTIGVDFEGKHRDTWDDDPKWVERNAKLRTSRKVLFVGGLIPALECRQLAKDEMATFLEQRFSEPATDRLARAFAEYDAGDAGKRFFTAYDRWIEILSSPADRAELAELTFTTREWSALFAEIRTLGERLESALLALLFDTKLGPVTRKYAVL